MTTYQELAKLPAAIYLRISLDKAADALGVARQDEECRDLAAYRRLNVAKIITDNDKSAKVAGKRDGFTELLRDIESGAIRVVVAWNFDRLLRNDREKLQLLELGQKMGITIILARGPELDLSTATGRMIAGVLADLAKWEIELKAERHGSANLQKAKAGKPHASRRPFGYEMGYAAIRPAEAVVYQQMVRRIIAGHSCQDIAKWLNANGHVTTQGKHWYPVTVRNMLVSPRYLAVREYQGVQYPGAWQPLITRADYELVQFELTKRGKYQGAPLHARKYILTGKLLCGRCENKLTGMRQKDRPTVPTRRTYACRPSSAGLFPGCHLRRNADALDAFVRDTVIYMFDTPELAVLLHGGRPDDEELQDLIAQRENQAKRKDSLVNDYSTGLLDADEFALAKQSARLELERLDHEIERRTALSSAHRMIDAGQSLRAAWDANGTDWRRRLVSLAHPGEIIVHPTHRKPFYLVDGQRYRFDQEAIEFNF